jgi:predicted GNAT family N-acyltransferase
LINITASEYNIANKIWKVPAKYGDFNFNTGNFNMKTEFVAKDQFSEIQNEHLYRLRAAVYPPEVLATLPGIKFSWASPQWSVLLWDGDELISRVGLITREIISNGEKKTIGGVGGVMTHPHKQGKGYGSHAMREAAKIFDSELKVAFALLFCRAHLVEFYKHLQWKPFKGLVFVAQPHGKIEFSANGAMVLDIKEPAPLNGVLDLNGLPW